MRYNDLEQTKTLSFYVVYVRIEIKTLVILRMLSAYTASESNQYIVFCYSEQFISANFIPYFLQFSFRLLCMALFVLKNEYYLLKTLLSDLEA